MRRTQGKQQPLATAGVHALRDEYTRTIEPVRALAAETLTLERTRKDLVNQACALTPAEIELLWKTAPPRMPMPVPNSETAKAMARDEGVERETERGRPYSAALYQLDLNARRA